MKCYNCNTENNNDAKFCNTCGKPINLICPSCNTHNDTNSKYCSNCGKPLLSDSSQLFSTVNKSKVIPKFVKSMLGIGVFACVMVGYISYEIHFTDSIGDWDVYDSYALLNIFMCIFEAIILITLFFKFELKKQCFTVFVPYILLFMYVLLWLSPSERDYLGEGLYIIPAMLTIFVVLIFISFFTKYKSEKSWWNQLN